MIVEVRHERTGQIQVAWPCTAELDTTAKPAQHGAEALADAGQLGDQNCIAIGRTNGRGDGERCSSLQRREPGQFRLDHLLPIEVRVVVVTLVDTQQIAASDVLVATP